MSFVNAGWMVSRPDAGFMVCVLLRDAPGLAVLTRRCFRCRRGNASDFSYFCHKTRRSRRPGDFKPREGETAVKITMPSWGGEAKVWLCALENQVRPPRSVEGPWAISLWPEAWPSGLRLLIAERGRRPM